MMADPRPDHLDSLTWFNHLYGTAEEGWLTVFSLEQRTGDRKTDWARVTDLPALAAAAARREPEGCVWFGVATRSQRLGGNLRGGAEDCLAFPGLWVDIDIDGPGHKGAHRLARDRAHAMEIVDAFPLPPTVVIDSGGGLQAWWLFSEMVDYDEDFASALSDWGATWLTIGEDHGVDLDNVFEAARVMRLPGTTNRKEGLARPVTLVLADWEQRYGLDDIETYLDTAEAPAYKSDKRSIYIGPDRPGDAFSVLHSGSDVLASEQWTFMKRHRNGNESWCRPGKDPRGGLSAMVYADDGHTTIYSDTVTNPIPGMEVRQPYKPFQLYAFLKHDGKFSAAASELRKAGYGSDSPMVVIEEVDVATLVPPKEGEVDEWPEPIPLGADHELPPFPIQVLPDWMANYALQVADDIQVPVDLPATLAIGALSTLAAGRLKVRVIGRWTEHVNLYLVVAMPPSTGKSPSYKAMCRPVREVEKEYVEQTRATIGANADMVDVIEAELKRAKGLADVQESTLTEIRTRLYAAQAKPTTPLKLTITDATPEALEKLIADNGGRMAVHSTEGGVFGMMAGRYSEKASLDVYLNGWSSDAIDSMRISRGGNEADEGVLTMLLTVQPSVIAALAEQPELAGRGLTARFMYSVPPDTLGFRDLSLRERFDDSDHDLYGEEMRSLGRRFLSWQNPATVTLGPEASVHYTDWRQAMEGRRKPDGDLRSMAEWTGKLESSVLRVAGLLHMAHGYDYGAPLSLHTMAQAIALGEYWLAHAGHVHDVWGSSPDLALARRILTWAEGTRRTTFSVRELYSANRALFKKADDTLAPLALLVERGWIRTTDGGPVTTQRNKRSVEFTLHPELSTVSARSARSVLKGETESLSLLSENEEKAQPPTQNAQNAQNQDLVGTGQTTELAPWNDPTSILYDPNAPDDDPFDLGLEDGTDA